MRTVVSSSLAVLLLAGCEPSQPLHKWASALAADVNVSIPAGHPVAVDGQAFRVVGTDQCPRDDPATAWLFGPPRPESFGCIVVTPETKAVTLFVLDSQAAGGSRKEVWSVQRHEGRPGAFSFKRTRPDQPAALASQV